MCFDSYIDTQMHCSGFSRLCWSFLDWWFFSSLCFDFHLVICLRKISLGVSRMSMEEVAVPKEECCTNC